MRSCDRVNKLIMENLSILQMPLDGSENDNRNSEAPHQLFALDWRVEGNQDNALLERALQRMREGNVERVPLSPLIDGSSSPDIRSPPSAEAVEAPNHFLNHDETLATTKDTEGQMPPIRCPSARKNSSCALSA